MMNNTGKGMKRYRKLAVLMFASIVVLVMANSAFAGNRSYFKTCSRSHWGVKTTTMFWVHVRFGNKAEVYQWDAKYYATGSGARISSTGKAKLGPDNFGGGFTTRYKQWASKRHGGGLDIRNWYSHTLIHEWKLYQGSNRADLECRTTVFIPGRL